jgi:Fe-S-cluster containining protein
LVYYHTQFGDGVEFTIDLAAVRKILQEENWAARQDVTAFGPMRAYAQSVPRHDERLVQANDIDTLACKPGCSWCCHFSVDVRAYEALNIVDYVEREFSLRDKLQLKSELATNARILARFDEVERAHRNIKCPFLSDGMCRIYPVRPQTCRNYHATDVTGCKQSFEHPDNDDIPPDYAPGVYQAGGAHVEAFSAAVSEAGYDAAAYEMNAALLKTLGAPEDVMKRFLSHRNAFENLAGVEVPFEFIDLLDDETQD